MIALILGCGPADVDTDETDGGDTSVPIDDGPLEEDDFSSRMDGMLFESEASVAIGPAGHNAGAAWIAYDATGGSTKIGWSVSHDGGAHWTAPQLIPTDLGFGTDPVVQVDGEGRVLITWLGFERTGFQPTDMHIFVSSTAPGGDALTTVDVTGSRTRLDKPWAVVDADDRVVLLYTGGDVGEGLESAISTDHGRTFTTRTVTDHGYITSLCTDREPGTPITAVYLDLGDVAAIRSTDGGETWDDPRKIPGVVGEADAATPSCAARGDDVWAAWPGGDYEAYDHVALAHASGGTWESAMQLDPLGGGLYGFPQIAAGEDGVAIAALHADADQQPTAVLLARGEPPDLVTTAIVEDVGPFSFRRDTLPWYGDYFGLSIGPESVLIAHPVAAADEGFATHVELRRVAR